MLGDLHQENIKKTAIILGIPEAFVRKDYYVTLAIQVLINIQDEFYALVFQGGTSLSKGYKIINRMSEDVDFRVVLKPEGFKLGNASRRRKLRNFRHKLIAALNEQNFLIGNEDVRVLYEGRYMRVNAHYESSDDIVYLKPHIQLECFLGQTKLPYAVNDVTSLTKVTLKHESQHTSARVTCIALDETAAEKWVALTRRIANSQLKSRAGDKHLVRHLYDLYHLNESGLLTGEYQHLVAGLLEKDSQQFKKNNAKYTEDPIQVSKEALDFLGNDMVWRQHWENFMTQMVYEENKPSFDQAYQQLLNMSASIFNALDKTVTTTVENMSLESVAEI